MEEECNASGGRNTDRRRFRQIRLRAGLRKFVQLFCDFLLVGSRWVKVALPCTLAGLKIFGPGLAGARAKNPGLIADMKTKTLALIHTFGWYYTLVIEPFAAL